MTKLTETMVNEVLKEIKAIMGDANGDVRLQKSRKITVLN